MGEANSDLDNQIFALQQTKGLPDDLRQKVRAADVAYLQDRDGEAYRLLGEVEEACKKAGIAIANPAGARL